MPGLVSRSDPMFMTCAGSLRDDLQDVRDLCIPYYVPTERSVRLTVGRADRHLSGNLMGCR